MRHILAACAAAVVLATPALAQVNLYAFPDFDLRNDQEQNPAAQDAVPQAPSESGSSAGDATRDSRSFGTSAPLSSRQDSGLGGSRDCPSGENEAGLKFHSGGYCLPGGRS